MSPSQSGLEEGEEKQEEAAQELEEEEEAAATVTNSQASRARTRHSPSLSCSSCYSSSARGTLSNSALSSTSSSSLAYSSSSCGGTPPRTRRTLSLPSHKELERDLQELETRAERERLAFGAQQQDGDKVDQQEKHHCNQKSPLLGRTARERSSSALVCQRESREKDDLSSFLAAVFQNNNNEAFLASDPPNSVHKHKPDGLKGHLSQELNKDNHNKKKKAQYRNDNKRMDSSGQQQGSATSAALAAAAGGGVISGTGGVLSRRESSRRKAALCSSGGSKKDKFKKLIEADLPSEQLDEEEDSFDQAALDVDTCNLSGSSPSPVGFRPILTKDARTKSFIVNGCQVTRITRKVLACCNCPFSGRPAGQR